MSPDAFTAASSLRDGFSADDLSFEPIIPLLLAHGVRRALGHFTRADPNRSAAMIEIVWSSSWGGRSAPITCSTTCG
jgi:hypothetical protein